MNKYVSQQGKQLLRNTIQSSNSQNKILEQNLMWKVHDTKRTSSHDSGYDDYRRVKRKKFSNDGDGLCDVSPRPSGSSNGDDNNGGGNYWMKKLIKEEEKRPERWGHTGYRELYPEDFKSDQESSDTSGSSADEKNNKKKKAKKKAKKLKKMKKKSKKHKKHRRK